MHPTSVAMRGGVSMKVWPNIHKTYYEAFILLVMVTLSDILVNLHPKYRGVLAITDVTKQPGQAVESCQRELY